jgi:hypothetical protein
MSPAVKLAPARPTQALTLDHLVIHGDKGVAVSLLAATTQAVHEETLEGASTVTLTVRDPDRRLLRSTIVRTRATLTLDRVEYRLVKVARAGNQVTLTFEDAAANVLRDYSSPKKANRANGTRAQFVRSLVREPRDALIPFHCPEINVKQPIAPVKK